MATRRTIHVLKNSVIPGQSLPSSGVKPGEPLINLGDGILFFSGGTAGVPTWVPSDNNANYFEVGSNLYNLKLRNQLTTYQGISGSGLIGKFLSGTTTGFVLADISSIQGVDTDSYVTGGTWSPNTLTLSLNGGKPSVPVTIDSFNNLNLYGTTNVNGNLTVTGTSTFNGLTYYNNTATASNEVVNYGLLTAYTQTNDVYTTGGISLTSASNNTPTQSLLLGYNGTPIGGPYSVVTENTFTTGGTYNNSSKNITFTKNDSTQYSVDLSNIDTNDTYVTGGTNTSSTNNTNNASISLEYNQDVPNGTYSLSYTDSYTTGATLNGSVVSFYRNDGTPYSVDLGSLSPTGFTDTYVTGFTKSGNILTILRNQGEPNLTVDLSTLQSLTVNGNLTTTGQTTTNDLLVNNFVLGSLIPDTGCTYDLGSTTNRWNDVWAKKVKIGTCTTDLEDDGSQFIITVGGTSSGATINLNGGNLNIGGDVLPIGDLTYNLGEPLNRWNNVYAANISASAITVSNLSPNRVVYTNGSGSLATETGFEYNESTDRMTVGALTVNNPTGTTSYIGQGGLEIGSGGSTSTPGIGDLIVHGNLDVFGTTTTISTSELYIEDPQITLNYNPTGNTSPTSIASGFKIQDGAGVVSTDVYLTIAQMNTFIGGDVTEYSGPTGYTNRGWLTQLNDIVIRNTNLNNGAPDGVRVLAEFDCLDGGTY